MPRIRQNCATPRQSDPAGSGAADRTRRAALSDTQVERYSRQIILPQVGGRGQAALLSATVTIVGSNEMATTAALYLAAAGVGHLRLSAATAAAIGGLNPDCHLDALASDAAAAAVRGVAAVLCAGVGAAAEARIHAAGVAARAPMILGHATDTVGWMAVGAGDAPCYRCLTRQRGGTVDNAAPLSTVTAGFIGTLLATEAIAILLSLRPHSDPRRITFDARVGEIHDEPLTRDPQCVVCGGHA